VGVLNNVKAWVNPSVWDAVPAISHVTRSSSSYRVHKLIEKYGRRGNMMKWKGQLKGDCPKRDAHNLHERCDLVCPDLPKSYQRCYVTRFHPNHTLPPPQPTIEGKNENRPRWAACGGLLQAKSRRYA
jgi:hypothetical protein